MAEFVEVIPFLTDDAAFVYGFEAGVLYQRMRNGEDHITGAFHALNEEQLLVIAGRMGYRVVRQRQDDSWIALGFLAPTTDDAEVPDDDG